MTWPHLQKIGFLLRDEGFGERRSLVPSCWHQTCIEMLLMIFRQRPSKVSCMSSTQTAYPKETTDSMAVTGLAVSGYRLALFA